MSARYVLPPFPSSFPTPEKDNQLLTSRSFPEWNAAAHGDSEKGTTPNAMVLKEGPSQMSFSKERIILPGRPGRRGLYQTSNLERGLVSARLLRHPTTWHRVVKGFKTRRLE